MAWSNRSALILSVAALGTAGYLLVLGMKDRERLRILETQVSELHAANEASRSISSPAPPEAGQDKVGTVSSEIVAAVSGLSEDAYNLGQTVEKLEKMANVLDSRIVRSRLAVPDQKEREAQMERGRKRLEELRKSATEAREKARQIAVSLKLPVDEAHLLEPGVNPALEEKPEFVAARDAAAAQQRVVEQFEKKLTELHFSNVVEGLPH